MTMTGNSAAQGRLGHFARQENRQQDTLSTATEQTIGLKESTRRREMELTEMPATGGGERGHTPRDWLRG